MESRRLCGIRYFNNTDQLKTGKKERYTAETENVQLIKTYGLYEYVYNMQQTAIYLK